MEYHNLYHRIDGILLAYSKHSMRQWPVMKNLQGIGIHNKTRNILNEY